MLPFFDRNGKKENNNNHKMISIAMSLFIWAFGHLSTWLCPRTRKFLPPIILIFPFTERRAFSIFENWKQGRRSKDLLMQSMTDRRTLDRSESENWPDVTELVTQDIFRNMSCKQASDTWINMKWNIFCSLFIPLKIQAMTNRNWHTISVSEERISRCQSNI